MAPLSPDPITVIILSTDWWEEDLGSSRELNLPGLGQEIMEDKIKKIELEIKRLKKLPDYEYVILDLKQEKKELKKLQATSSKLDSQSQRW